MKNKLILQCAILFILASCNVKLFVPDENVLREKDGFLLRGNISGSNVTYFIEAKTHQRFGSSNIHEAFVVSNFLNEAAVNYVLKHSSVLELIEPGGLGETYTLSIAPVKISYLVGEKIRRGQETLLLKDEKKVIFNYSIYRDLKLVDIALLSNEDSLIP